MSCGHLVEKYTTMKKIRHNLQVEVAWYIMGQGQVVCSGTCPSAYHTNSYSSVHTLHLFLSVFTCIIMIKIAYTSFFTSIEENATITKYCIRFLNCSWSVKNNASWLLRSLRQPCSALLHHDLISGFRITKLRSNPLRHHRTTIIKSYVRGIF